MPGIGGFPSSHTGTSGSPIACPPGLRRSPHPALPLETTGDLICTEHNEQSVLTFFRNDIRLPRVIRLLRAKTLFDGMSWFPVDSKAVTSP